MYAGSARVAVSLWNVNDQRYILLMSLNFLQTFAATRKITRNPESCNKIKMWQQKDWQNPYYWSALHHARRIMLEGHGSKHFFG